MFDNDKEIAEQIRKLIPINELTEKIQNKLIANEELLELKKGKYLFHKGDQDHFSYYLLSGEIELVSDRQIHDTIKGGSDRSLYPMAQLQPRQFSALAKTSVQIFKVNRTVLDKLLLISKESSDKKVDLADTISGPGQLEVNEIDEQEGMDWMSRMLQSELFMKIPSGNIQKLFGLLESHHYKADDVVIEQGQEGQHYYVIQEGSCVVTRKAGASSNPIKLAELKVGDSFGEESLLMDTKCNATVSMKTAGVLMRLSKNNFIELIKKPTLQNVGYAEALELIKVGAEWLDVRFESEHDESHIANSQNIPLNLLRTQIKKLSQDKQYVVYCDTGARSSAAAFLMTERGYKALYLDGGLISHHDISNLISNKPEEQASDEPLTETKDQPQSTAELATDSVLEDVKETVVAEPQSPEPDTESTDIESPDIQSQGTDSPDTESIEPTGDIKSDNTVSKSSDDQQMAKMKRDFDAYMVKEKKSLQMKYTEAQRMLDKAKLIKQDAEKSKQRLEGEISKRNSVIELSQQKILKELQDQIKELESGKDKLEEKNKTLLNKRVELENDNKKLIAEIKSLTDEKNSLSEKFSELTETAQIALEEKQKTEREAVRIHQEAKRIVEVYKNKYKQLFTMEEEKIQQELNTLDEITGDFVLDVQPSAVEDSNLNELDQLKSKKISLSLGKANQDKKQSSSDDDESQKLMDDISSQLGSGS